MLILRNITSNDNIISADYFPEGKEGNGFLSIDKQSKEVIEKKLSSFETDDKPNYFAMARQYLRQIINEIDIPIEKTIMWY